MYWTIPYVLSIICSILNSQIGILEIMILVFEFFILYTLYDSVQSTIKIVKKEYMPYSVSLVDMSVANLIRTSFMFLLINMTTNFISILSFLPEINSAINNTEITNILNKPNVCMEFFIAGMILHGISMAIIIVKGFLLRKDYDKFRKTNTQLNNKNKTEKNCIKKWFHTFTNKLSK